MLIIQILVPMLVVVIKKLASAKNSRCSFHQENNERISPSGTRAIYTGFEGSANTTLSFIEMFREVLETQN